MKRYLRTVLSSTQTQTTSAIIKKLPNITYFSFRPIPSSHTFYSSESTASTLTIIQHSEQTSTKMPSFQSVLAIAAPPFLSVPRLAVAEQCSAVGEFNTNSAGFGDQGTTYTNTGSVTIYRGTDAIGNSTGNMCGDYLAVDSELPLVFG